MDPFHTNICIRLTFIMFYVQYSAMKKLIAVALIAFFAFAMVAGYAEAGSGDEHRTDNSIEYSTGNGEPPEDGQNRAEDRLIFEDR